METQADVLDALDYETKQNQDTVGWITNREHLPIHEALHGGELDGRGIPRKLRVGELEQLGKPRSVGVIL